MNATRNLAMPTPTQTERDADGRLVGLIIDSGQRPPTAKESPWLVAIDASEHSLRVTGQAARLSGLMGSCSVMQLATVQPWLAKEVAESELPRRGWEATAAARRLLDEAGTPWRLHIRMGDAAECIVALANRLGCEGIVIGSSGLGATQAWLLGSVSYKVIHLSKVSVLVVH